MAASSESTREPPLFQLKRIGRERFLRSERLQRETIAAANRIGSRSQATAVALPVVEATTAYAEFIRWAIVQEMSLVADRSFAGDACRSLQLVHRGLRHRRPEGRHGVTGRVEELGPKRKRTCAARSAELTIAKGENSVPNAVRPSHRSVRDVAQRTSHARSSAASVARRWEHPNQPQLGSQTRLRFGLRKRLHLKILRANARRSLCSSPTSKDRWTLWRTSTLRMPAPS